MLSRPIETAFWYPSLHRRHLEGCCNTEVDTAWKLFVKRASNGVEELDAVFDFGGAILSAKPWLFSGVYYMMQIDSRKRIPPEPLESFPKTLGITTGGHAHHLMHCVTVHFHSPGSAAVGGSAAAA